MHTKNFNIYFIIFSFLTITFFTMSGCSNSMFSGSKKSAVPRSSKQANAVYYDFEDILVPRDMKIDDGSTVVVSTPGNTSGIITLKGRIDKDSLLKFFNNNMQKDNWNIISQIRSPAATILIFQKVSRWAVITLREKEYYTYAEIGVAPSVGGVPYSNSEMSTPSNSSDYNNFSNSNSNSPSGNETIKSENLFE